MFNPHHTTSAEKSHFSLTFFTLRLNHKWTVLNTSEDALAEVVWDAIDHISFVVKMLTHPEASQKRTQYKEGQAKVI